MIVPDVNLLVYAYNSDSSNHEAAAHWWEDCMNGSEEIGLTTIVVLGFVRICTHPKIFKNPLTISEASDRAQSWLARPRVRIIERWSKHIDEVLEILRESGTAGNLTTDAQIAALARQEMESSQQRHGFFKVSRDPSP